MKTALKVSVLSPGLADPWAAWAPIDELAALLVRYFNAELLLPQPQDPSSLQRLMGGSGASYGPVQTDGGDVLIVVARMPADLAAIRSITDYRRKFKRIVAWVTDSYFQAGFTRDTAEYDAITVTAHEDIAFVRDKFSTSVHQCYQGADCLTWVPRQEVARSIDLISFGRTPPSYHRQLQQDFHGPDSPYLYLHSPLGNLQGPIVQTERGMLFKVLRRTSFSLAFHLFVEPQGNRPRSTMVTSRWLESLLSGCIVAGKRPQSRMAEEMLFWPGSTVELSDDAVFAVQELIEMLKSNDGFVEQRRSNIRHMLLHHDWRFRIRQLCEIFALEVPALLLEDLDRVQSLAGTFE